MNGVANNDRLILGDDPDVDGASHCFDHAYREGMDTYLLNVARERRKGIVCF